MLGLVMRPKDGAEWEKACAVGRGWRRSEERGDGPEEDEGKKKLFNDPEERRVDAPIWAKEGDDGGRDLAEREEDGEIEKGEAVEEACL
jgi:hypothetical protein